MALKNNKLVNLSTAVVCLVLSNELLACSIDMTNVYVGLDVAKTNYTTQELYGSNTFAKNPTAFNAFVGYNLPKNFSLEAGYESRPTKTRQTVLTGGRDVWPGNVLVTPGTTTYNIDAKTNEQLPYMGLSASYSPNRSPNTFFSALVGASLVKIKASYAITAIAGVPLTATLIDASRINFTKKKVAPVVKLSVNHIFSNNVGVRATGTWHRLNNFKINSNENSSYQIRPKNSLAFGLGVFYQF